MASHSLKNKELAHRFDVPIYNSVQDCEDIFGGSVEKEKLVFLA